MRRVGGLQGSCVSGWGCVCVCVHMCACTCVCARLVGLWHWLVVLAWLGSMCVHVAGGAAAPQAEKRRHVNEVQTLWKELVSASVSPLPAVKLVSRSPGSGSDLQLGTEVESSHSHMLPQHLSCKCHQTSPLLSAGPAVPPWDWEGALGLKSHISLLAPRHWQLSLGLLPEAQQEIHPQKLGEVLPPPGTRVGMYAGCCGVSKPPRVVWFQLNPPSPCPPPTHLPANIFA